MLVLFWWFKKRRAFFLLQRMWEGEGAVNNVEMQLLSAAGVGFKTPVWLNWPCSVFFLFFFKCWNNAASSVLAGEKKMPQSLYRFKQGAVFKVSWFIRGRIKQASFPYSGKTAHSATHTQPTNSSATGQFQHVRAACFLLLNPTSCIIIVNVFTSPNMTTQVHFSKLLWTQRCVLISVI